MTKKDLIQFIEELRKEERSFFILISPSAKIPDDEQALFATHTVKEFHQNEMFRNIFEQPSQEDVLDFFIRLISNIAFEKIIARIEVIKAKKNQEIN